MPEPHIPLHPGNSQLWGVHRLNFGKYVLQYWNRHSVKATILYTWPTICLYHLRRQRKEVVVLLSGLFGGTAAFLGICLILNKITRSKQQNKLKNKVPSGYVDCAFSLINLCLPKCDQKRSILVLSWDLWW